MQTLYDMTKAMVKDDSTKLTDPADFDAAVIAAIKRYSKHRPRFTCADIPGQAGPDISLPDNWCPEFSVIEAIEYPIGCVPESLLDRCDWRFYRTPTDTYIRFNSARPAAAENVRLLYTIQHGEATIPENDREAVANLAASFCLRQLAAAYGQTSDATIGADVVNYRSKADEFRRLADSFEALYKQHLGIRDTDAVAAASVTAAPPAVDLPRFPRLRR